MWKFIIKYLKAHKDSIISDPTSSFTYKELIKIIKEHGENLSNYFVPGAKCAVLCDKGLNTAIAILSCWYANLTPIPLSLNYGSEHCAKIIELTCPSVVITDTPRSNAAFQYNIIDDKFTGKYNQLPYEPVLDDVAAIMCTSGTTGFPKGAMITNSGLKANVKKIAKYFNIEKSDTILIARPLYHCAVLSGEFLVSIVKGLNICFLDEMYNPLKVLQCASEKHVTVICGTPTLLNHMSQFVIRNKMKNSITTIAVSGENLCVKTGQQLRTAFPNAAIYNVYGLTEASPRVSYLEPELFNSHLGSVGKPLPGVKIKVVAIDNLTQEVDTNKPGLVVVKTPCAMKGYYRNCSATKRTFHNGWLVTGDIGFIDKSGFLYICSRIDDMIIKGGMNIYPCEIENVIEKIIGVEECLVYGKSVNIETRICVDVVLASNPEITKKELASEIKSVLPRYQIPSVINIVDSIKKNGSGKKNQKTK